MISSQKAKHVKEFIESTPDDNRHRSEAIARLAWMEETESDRGVLNNQVDKIAAGFTENTGIAVPEYIKPARQKPIPAEAEPAAPAPVKKPAPKKSPGPSRTSSSYSRK